MMAAALILLTLLVVLLPLIPAFKEWRTPTDITPLPIDGTDALEPDYMARRFSQKLGDALNQADAKINGVPLVFLARDTAKAPWPLSKEEVRTNRTRRIWHAEGDCTLPEHLHCLAEMSALGSMRAAAGHTYRALLSHSQLTLPAHTNVMRWAHAHRVSIGDACKLPGRMSAESVMLLGREVSFSLLHAPAIRFVGIVPPQLPIPPSGWWSVGRADGVLWDEEHRLGTASHALHVAPLRRWRGDLTCHDQVTLGEGCIAEGDIRAAGAMNIAAGCKVYGSLMSAGEIYLAAGAAVQGSVVSETRVVLGPGCMVGVPGAHVTVRAPKVQVGKGAVVHGTVWSGKHTLRVGVDDQDRDSFDTEDDGPGEAVQWNPISGRGVVPHSLKVPPRRQWHGDLVCQGDLQISHRCHINGSLKSYGATGLGSGCHVQGNVVAQGDILVGAGTQVTGSVISETAVVLGPGCSIGTPEKPATVCAPRIEIALGVTVHGTVWAGNTGGAQGRLHTAGSGSAADEAPGWLPGRAVA